MNKIPLKTRLRLRNMRRRRNNRNNSRLRKRNKHNSTNVRDNLVIEEKNIILKHNEDAIIYLKSKVPVDIYYNKDAKANLTAHTHKFINVTEHEFKIGDNLSKKLYMSIKRKANVEYDFSLRYEHNPKNKYAVIVGISDYRYISDLSYCDEDATDWVRYLEKQGYQCHVLGDIRKRNYPQYDGLATEQNVRDIIRKIGAISDYNTKFAFTTSGHGSGDNKGNSYLCMYDFRGIPRGKYTDKEFCADIKTIKGQKFVFFDHCSSGGMLDELKSLEDIFATSTCSEKGYGWDMTKYKNGAWTHCFLQKAILEKYSNGGASLKDIFDYASSIFIKETGHNSQYDQPMYVSSDGNMFL